MEFVHMHEGLVRFPAVAGIVESGPPDVELHGGSSIAVAAVSKDRLNDELLLIVLSFSQRMIFDLEIESVLSITWNGPRCLCKSLLPRPSRLMLMGLCYLVGNSTTHLENASIITKRTDVVYVQTLEWIVGCASEWMRLKVDF